MLFQYYDIELTDLKGEMSYNPHVIVIVLIVIAEPEVVNPVAHAHL